MTSRHQQTLKKIHDGLSDEKKLNNLLFDKLFRSVLNGNRAHASILVKAIEILFPGSNVMIADSQFQALWKLGKNREAIKVYLKANRTIFWYAERIGLYYERNGLMSKAVQEYEFLMKTYSKMGSKGILPLPNGPRQLFLLGQWYADKNVRKAKKFLDLYLSAEKIWRKDPSLPHKNQARRILNRLERPREVGYVV